MDRNRECSIIIKGDSELEALFNGERDSNLLNVLTTELYYLLETQCQAGNVLFYCFTAKGFDLLAIEQLLKLKEKYTHIELAFYLSTDCDTLAYSNKEQQLYRFILNKLERVEFIDSTEYAACVEKLTENVTKVITYCVGNDGESNELVASAKAKGVVVENIYDQLTDYFACTHPAKQLMQAYPDATNFRYSKSGIVFAYEDIPPLYIDFVRIASVSCENDCFALTLANGLEMTVPVYEGKDPLVKMAKIPEIVTKDFLKKEGIEFDNHIKNEAEANEAMGTPTTPEQ